MASTTITRPSAQLGPGIAVAALAGLVGIALAFIVAAGMLLNPGTARLESQPGYPDFGLRHPAIVAPDASYPDFGLRHPAVVAPDASYTDFGLRHRAVVPAVINQAASDARLDDYGIRCTANGWCSQPSSQNGHR